MKKTYLFAAAIVAVAGVVALTGIGLAGGQLKSGPQVGEKLAGPFHPLNCSGKEEGKKNCLYCENGTSPVAMIFARDTSPELTKLIKAVDEVTEAKSKWNMGSFVVVLSDKESMPKDLTTLAKDQKLKHTVLAVDNPAGPEGYNVAKDASITVVLYLRHTVAANHTFRNASDLNAKAIEQIINDVSKIEPK